MIISFQRKNENLHEIHNLDKKISESSLSLRMIQQELKIDKKTISDNKKKILEIESKIESIKHELETRKKFSKFISDNWYRAPMVIVGILIFSNWIYELPSKDQLAELERLKTKVELNRIMIKERVKDDD